MTARTSVAVNATIIPTMTLVASAPIRTTDLTHGSIASEAPKQYRPMVRKDDQGRRLCTAHTAKGVLCRSPALKGATVCRMHGGSAPQVKAKAARTLLEELIEPALMALRDIVQDVKQPASARVAAARDILDRTGFKPVIQVQGVPTLAVLEGWKEDLEAEIENG